MKASLISDRSKQNTVLSAYRTMATHPLPHQALDKWKFLLSFLIVIKVTRTL